MKSKTKILAKILIAFCLMFLIASCDKSLNKVKDIDGNEYDVVKIGDQYWLKQNLRTSKYNDRNLIQDLSNKDPYDTTWDKDAIGAFTIYAGTNNANKVKNNNEYGKLYNWYAVNTGILAPKGWHVATKADFDILDNYLGHANGGAKMKTTTGWNNNANTTNSSNFSAKPGGYKNMGYGFSNDMGESAYFWTAKSLDQCPNDLTKQYPICIILHDAHENITPSSCYSKNFGMSVRCVKD